MARGEAVDAAAWAACAGIQAVDLRGDCQLLAARPDAEGGARAEGVCGRIDAGSWQDECWFQSAEAAARAGREGRAAALCRKAGPFAADCAQHLWQGDLYTLSIQAPDPQQLLPRAERLHARWAPHLDDGADFDRRFWALAFQQSLVGGRIDLGRCAGLPQARLDQCRGALVERYGRDLAPALERAGLDLCQLRPAGVADLDAALPAAPDPALDALLVQRVAASCGP